jgi:quercetin dioxygenase-like cupin family protein
MILRGQLHLQIADEASEVVADVQLFEGDIFYIGNGVRHRADAVGTETCVGLLVCPKAYSIAAGQPFWTA